jgi:hypothetical protein
LSTGSFGKTWGKRASADRAEEVERLYRERYQGFTVKHFHEHLVKDHGFGWATPGRSCIFSGRAWSEGTAQEGRTGGSANDDCCREVCRIRMGRATPWLKGQPPLDLIVTLDDATGEMYFGVSGRWRGHSFDLSGAERGISRRKCCRSACTRTSLWKCGQRVAPPTVPKANKSRGSGQLMRYQNRAIRFAIDSSAAA